MNADLTTHRIEGIARMGNTPFSVPLISKLGDFGLGAEVWQGGCINGTPLEGFDLVVSLYPWEKYRIPVDTARFEVPLYDALGFVPANQLDMIAEVIDYYVQCGMNVLVHCQAGLNRSSLVLGHWLVRKQGMTGKTAVALIRESRSPACLCNEEFEAYVEGLE